MEYLTGFIVSFLDSSMYCMYGPLKNYRLINTKSVCLPDTHVYKSKLYHAVALIILLHMNSFGSESTWWNDSKDRHWRRHAHCQHPTPQNDRPASYSGRGSTTHPQVPGNGQARVYSPTGSQGLHCPEELWEHRAQSLSQYSWPWRCLPSPPKADHNSARTGEWDHGGVLSHGIREEVSREVGYLKKKNSLKLHVWRMIKKFQSCLNAFKYTSEVLKKIRFWVPGKVLINIRKFSK